MDRHKTCSRCERTKYVEDFDINKDGKYGVGSVCRACRGEQRRENNDKIKVQRAQFREANREALKAQQRAQYADNREEICARVRKYNSEHREQKAAYDRKKRYGLDGEQWLALFDAQGNACAICCVAEPGGKGWATDHDHDCCPGSSCCGKCVRQILCSKCNMALGLMRDDPAVLMSAIEYLIRHKERHATQED